MRMWIDLFTAADTDLILRSVLLARVSKDGRESMCCVHPSRRGEDAAPQDEDCVRSAPRMQRSALAGAADPGSRLRVGSRLCGAA